MYSLTNVSTGYICAYLNLQDTLRFNMVSKKINLMIHAQIHMVSNEHRLTLIRIIGEYYRIDRLVGAKINETVCMIFEFQLVGIGFDDSTNLCVWRSRHPMFKKAMKEPASFWCQNKRPPIQFGMSTHCEASIRKLNIQRKSESPN